MDKKWLAVFSMFVAAAHAQAEEIPGLTATGGGKGTFHFASDEGTGAVPTLGSGLKSVWQLQGGFVLDGSGSGMLLSRNSVVGVAGPFAHGLSRLARPQSPDIDRELWVDGGADGVDTFHRIPYLKNDALPYGTATFFGLNAAAEYSRDAAGRLPLSNDLWAIGLRYWRNGFYLQYGHDERIGPSSLAAPAKARADNIEAGYADGPLQLALAYQMAEGWDWKDRAAGGPSAAGTGLRTQEYGWSAAYSLGWWTPRLSYALGSRQRRDNAVGDNSYRQWLMGVDYNFTKQTKAVLSYGQLKYGNGGSSADSSDSSGVPHRENTLGIEFYHRF